MCVGVSVCGRVGGGGGGFLRKGTVFRFLIFLHLSFQACIHDGSHPFQDLILAVLQKVCRP